MSSEQKNLGDTSGPPTKLWAPAAWPPPNLAPKTLDEALRLLHARLFELEQQNAELRQAQGIAEAAAIADITKRKRAEETIRKISTAVEHSPNSVVMTDAKGLIEYVNPFFLETTGYSRSEVLGQNIRILKSSSVSSDDYNYLWQTILSGDVWRGELCNQKKSGEIFWERASISPIKDAQGAITSFVAVKEDITERKKADGVNAKLEAQLGLSPN
jgi:PAS domain S-box-containing protein